MKANEERGDRNSAQAQQRGSSNLPSASGDSEEAAFENYIAGTVDMSEPDAGTWEEVKAALNIAASGDSGTREGENNGH